MAEKSTRDLIPGLGAAIRTRREELGLSQQDLAEQIGAAKPTVGKLEREERAPSARLLLAIADALSTTMDALARPGEGSAAAG